VQVSFKIRNQLAIKPEIFTQGIANLEKTPYFWAQRLGLMFQK